MHGPYTRQRAETLAAELDGDWQHLQWKAVPLDPTPWETAAGRQRPDVATDYPWPPAPEAREDAGRALLYLDHRTLEHLLHMPAGMHIAAVAAHFPRMAVALLVESPDLPVVPPHTQVPELDGEFEPERKPPSAAGGYALTGWWRWVWSPRGETADPD